MSTEIITVTDIKVYCGSSARQKRGIINLYMLHKSNITTIQMHTIIKPHTHTHTHTHTVYKFELNINLCWSKRRNDMSWFLTFTY